jgi:hypothetical protein
VHLTVLTALTFLVGSSGLAWGVLNLQRAAVADELHSYETRLLQFEGFVPAAARRIVDSAAARDLSHCENHAQRALLLLEIPLAEAALRSGAVHDFDRRMRSIEDRSGRVLACAPRDTLAWLLLFGLEVMHGRINNHVFELLAASYETSPNEAWIGLRRVTVATPVLLSAPEAIRKKILDEFKNLIRRGFMELPARAYLAAPASVRGLLQSRIDELDPLQQKSFVNAVEKFRS